jgi:hypothetical protein
MRNALRRTIKGVVIVNDFLSTTGQKWYYYYRMHIGTADGLYSTVRTNRT